MNLHQLTPVFYAENGHLIEALDKTPGSQFKDKGRGYAVLVVKVKNIQFAIPLRSSMSIDHKYNFTTKTSVNSKGKKVRHGLDYSKAVIITSQAQVNEKIFYLKKKEDYLKIKKQVDKIQMEFEKMIEKYIRAVLKNDKNILREFRYSTLQNYHEELGLVVEKVS
ncbi:hypothetical protein [Exiguobacterium sp. s95]|uniref:type III toxin-antitoxin system TenpIN family toxin n=1 Tax=Exiguobacterium sp. s95 TaxID=2751211 RepID=UPI001BE54599|nr:hypothetical protein [Exiguobacterium sp. s95]